MFGISGPEFIVLLAVAAVVLGPERLPEYAQQLARLIRELRRMANGASAQVRAELGPEFDEVDWRKLDPRQYDPRRIVREALSDSLDLDDPLGLRDKPVSAGGPQAIGNGANGSAAAGGSAAGAGEQAASYVVDPEPPVKPVGGGAQAQPRIDPDAT